MKTTEEGRDSGSGSGIGRGPVDRKPVAPPLFVPRYIKDKKKLFITLAVAVLVITFLIVVM